MSGMRGTKRAAEPDPSSSSSSKSRGVSVHDAGGGSGGGGGSDGGGDGDGVSGGGDGGGGLHGITAAQKAFHFLEGPADVLRASTACRRWCELACAGSVWRVKAEREGILDKAAAFEVEVPWVQEGGQLEDEGTAAMALYARVFVLKVRGLAHKSTRVLRGCVATQISPPFAPAHPPPPCRGTR